MSESKSVKLVSVRLPILTQGTRVKYLRRIDEFKMLLTLAQVWLMVALPIALMGWMFYSSRADYVNRRMTMIILLVSAFWPFLALIAFFGGIALGLQDLYRMGRVIVRGGDE